MLKIDAIGNFFTLIGGREKMLNNWLRQINIGECTPGQMAFEHVLVILDGEGFRFIFEVEHPGKLQVVSIRIPIGIFGAKRVFD